MSTFLANTLVKKKSNNHDGESDQAKQNRMNANRFSEDAEKRRTEKQIETLEVKGFCIISASDLGDLESKQPVLYNQIYQKGVTAGKTTANKTNEILNDINARQKESPKDKSQQKVTVPGKDFEALVAEYRKEHKCSIVDAMSATAKAHPILQRDYVAELFKPKTREPGKENVGSRNGTEPRFKTLVDDYQAEHKCPRIEAIRAVAKLQAA